MKRFEIYPDGSCSSRHPDKLGGCGVYFQLWENDDQLKVEKTYNCGYSQTTISRMEQRAVCVALETIRWRDIPLTIISDSEFVMNSINLGWLWDWETKGFEGVKNPDLWIRFLNIYREYDPALLTFIHNRGHFKGDPRYWRGNNIADALADYRQFIEYIEDGKYVL